MQNFFRIFSVFFINFFVENDIEKCYIGGHSLGGSMAASYLADNTDDFDGLIEAVKIPFHIPEHLCFGGNRIPL